MPRIRTTVASRSSSYAVHANAASSWKGRSRRPSTARRSTMTLPGKSRRRFSVVAPSNASGSRANSSTAAALNSTTLGRVSHPKMRPG